MRVVAARLTPFEVVSLWSRPHQSVASEGSCSDTFRLLVRLRRTPQALHRPRRLARLLGSLRVGSSEGGLSRRRSPFRTRSILRALADQFGRDMVEFRKRALLSLKSVSSSASSHSAVLKFTAGRVSFWLDKGLVWRLVTHKWGSPCPCLTTADWDRDILP